MLLKNFYAAIFAPSFETGDKIPIKNEYGKDATYYRPNDKSVSSSYTPMLIRELYDTIGFYGMSKALATAKQAGRAIIGTGTTPPTFDDYGLSGSIITTISSSVASTSKTVEEDGITISTTWSITNTSDEAITIGEIAFWGGYNGSSNANSSSASKMCIERTVLEEPLTIEAGGVGQLTYTIRLKYPTA